MEITRVNPKTGEFNTKDLNITEDQYKEIMSPSGRLIQVIVPHLSVDDREFLIIGLLPEDFVD